MPRKRLTDEEYRARYGRTKPGPRRPEAKARIAEASRARIAAGQALTLEQRQRGGHAVVERYGPAYMAALGELSGQVNKVRRLEAELAALEAETDVEMDAGSPDDEEGRAP